MNKKKLRQKDIVNLIFSYICLIAIAILCAGPFIWLLLSSLRTGANIYDLHFKLEDFTFSNYIGCLLYTSPSPRDRSVSRMPSSA